MLLIMTNRTDHSTSEVIEWLLFYKANFRRLNGDEPLQTINIEIAAGGKSDIFFENINNVPYSVGEFCKFWYRRGDISTFRPIVRSNKKQALRMLNDEWEVVKDFILFNLEGKPHLGSLNKEKNNNKLINLLKAASAGLFIPATIVTTEKENLRNFDHLHCSITKAIKNLFLLNVKNRTWAVGTEKVREINFHGLQNRISPTLLQKEIKKSYELRVFFLGGDFYPMAIFSQSNDQTKVDFRNYDRQKPNRCIPYVLPPELKEKLSLFIKLVQMNTGSIDLIVTPENQFVFLEVNHIGQFGWLSRNCNYNIEEKIATHLINI